MSEIVLINVSGRDQPGLTASLTEILARYRVNVLDIGQAVIHDHLSLGLLIEIPREAEPSPILKDLVFRAYQLGLDVHFTPIEPEAYESWVSQQERTRFIITVLGRQLSAEHVARVAALIAAHGLNIDDITRLSERTPLHPTRRSRSCIELAVRGEPRDVTALRTAFMELSMSLDVDIAFQEDNVYRRNRRLVAFDMDSTLVKQEIIDELAAEAGAGEEVSRITGAAMRGEMDFAESLRRRVRHLAGLPESVLEMVAARLELTEGARRLVGTLKALGYKVAILSGGFTFFAERLRRELGFDAVYANELGIADGVLDGELRGEIIDGERKAELLRELARREGISMEQVIAVGDGANDIPMLSAAGLGIAFHAKSTVREEARQSISTVGLDAILYLMGIRDREAMVGSISGRRD